jgi:hypothetical protein
VLRNFAKSLSDTAIRILRPVHLVQRERCSAFNFVSQCVKAEEQDERVSLADRKRSAYRATKGRVLCLPGPTFT